MEGSFKLVWWQFQNLAIAMLEDEEGELWCTSQALCTALGITEHHLWNIRQRHGDRIHPVSLSERQAKEFMREHKEQFGIKRVRNDSLLWALDHALGVAFFVRSTTAYEFQQDLITLIKQQATKHTITEEQYKELIRQQTLVMEQQAEDRRRLEVLEGTAPALRTAATAAGRALQAQKGTQALRLIRGGQK